MPDELALLTTVENEFEAAVVCGRLEDAGIRSMQKLSNRGVGGRFGGGGVREVFVEKQDLDRAHEVLNAEAAD